MESKKWLSPDAATDRLEQSAAVQQNDLDYGGDVSLIWFYLPEAIKPTIELQWSSAHIFLIFFYYFVRFWNANQSSFFWVSEVTDSTSDSDFESSREFGQEEVSWHFLQQDPVTGDVSVTITFLISGLLP